MRVKIVKCSNPEHWYKDLVGKEFDAVYVTKTLLSLGGLIHGGSFVCVEDCEVLPETASRESLFNDEDFRRQLILALAGNGGLWYSNRELEPLAERILSLADCIMKAMKERKK
jgi:hypothetical protein